MIQKRQVEKKIATDDFFNFISKEDQEELQKLSESLEGKKITHFNATPKGGGVAELLSSLIPYLRSLGVETQWYTIDSNEVDKYFFEITDKLRDALQSKHKPLTEQEWELYKQVNEQLAVQLNKIETDLFVVHDWQVLHSGSEIDSERKKIYINHPDTSDPFKEVWDKILTMILKYDLYVFSNPTFIHGDFKGNDRTRVIRKAIDPLKEKQKIVSSQKAREYLSDFGIPEDGPLIVQVSRFDPWKNPHDVIKAFKKIKDDYPQAHLAMVGLQEAKDNPEAERVFQEVKELVEGDKRISLFFDPAEHSIESISEFTMYFQNAADIIVQNSIKEGFGLTVSEAMWKEKPVIGGPASGVKMQIKDGKNGCIASNRKELTRRMKELLEDPELADKLGKEGRKTVLEQFLFPRFVKDHLNVYNEVLNQEKYANYLQPDL